MDKNARDAEQREWLVETWAPAMLDWHRRYGPKRYGTDGSVHLEGDPIEESDPGEGAMCDAEEGTHVVREASLDDHLLRSPADYDDRWEDDDPDPSW